MKLKENVVKTEDLINIENKLNKVQMFFNDKNIFRYSPIIKNELIIKLRSKLLTKTKINFLMYWGVGTKSNMDTVDISAIKFQQQWLNELSSILELDYTITAIITDTHAVINNISTNTINIYKKKSYAVLTKLGYTPIYATTLLNKYNIDNIMDYINSYNIDNILENSSYKSILRGLERQSKAFSYIGNDDENHINYFKCNLIENSVIEEEYSKHIFITYSSPETKLLLPNLPKIHVYVDKKRQIKRPWFNKG
jgi:hypothetical protein